MTSLAFLIFSHSWRDGEMSEAFWSRSSKGHAWSWTTASTTSSWSTICWFLLSHCSLHRCGMVCDCLRCKWARSNSITQYSSAQLYKFYRNPSWFFNFHVVAVMNISHSCRDLQSPCYSYHPKSIQAAVGLLPGLSFSVAALVLGERLASFHYEHLACFVLSMSHWLAILRDEIQHRFEHQRNRLHQLTEWIWKICKASGPLAANVGH